MITKDNIIMNQSFNNKSEVIDFVGNWLYDHDMITEEYITSMHNRDQHVSVYLGNYLAIPHGEENSRQWVKKTGICFVHCAEPIDWDGNQVYFVVGLAASDDQHLEILANIAEIFMDEEVVEKMIKTPSVDKIYQIINSVA